VCGVKVIKQKKEMVKMNRIILTSDKEILNREHIISIECGLNDGEKHFDHNQKIDFNSDYFKKYAVEKGYFIENNQWCFTGWDLNPYWDGATWSVDLEEEEKIFKIKTFPAIATINKTIDRDIDIIISHLDAGTIIAIGNLTKKYNLTGCYKNYNMTEKDEFEMSLSCIAEADINGLHTIKKNSAYYFITGIEKLICPVATEKHIDVTEIVEKILSYSFYDIVKMGKIKESD
jgi:hypothetical protein